jgi:acetoin utilization deacetylase AcuC-like enzyme
MGLDALVVLKPDLIMVSAGFDADKQTRTHWVSCKTFV